MTAAAEYALDGSSAPPLLRRALNVRTWGLRDYFGVPAVDLPAGTLARINTVLSYYDACKSYKSAGGQTAQWARRNPDAWDLVSRILRDRMGT